MTKVKLIAASVVVIVILLVGAFIAVNSRTQRLQNQGQNEAEQPGSQVQVNNADTTGSTPTSGTSSTTNSGSGSVAPVSSPQTDIGTPTRITIPKLSINALVEQVGLDAQGRMDVPKIFQNVAWYNLGYKPGDLGSAVMSGHLDTYSGGPAVFWDLGKLQTGDEVTVTDDKGQAFNFKVTRKQSFSWDNFPLKEVFASSGKAQLNLITCSGNFNRSSRNYSQRLVVYAEMQ